MRVNANYSLEKLNDRRENVFTNVIICIAVFTVALVFLLVNYLSASQEGIKKSPSPLKNPGAIGPQKKELQEEMSLLKMGDKISNTGSADP